MLHFRFIFRQIRSSSKQALIFVLCVALSLLTLVSLGGFSSSVRSSMLKDARQLHAADIIIHSHYPLSPGLTGALKDYQEKGLAAGALVHEFYSMASNPARQKSVLSHLKVVEEGYPFYGAVELASGRGFSEVLKPGTIIVEQPVLDRLDAGLGDRLQIGSAELSIADTVIAEPDRPVSFFSFGPRIFIAAADLQRLDLIKMGSRIHYNYLLKVHDPAMVDRLAGELAAVAFDPQERVNTFENAESGVKRFFENFLFFLNLIGIFTLLLAGIGIQTALRALLRDSEYTIGVMKAVGATNRFICSHFIVMIMLLGTAGTGGVDKYPVGAGIDIRIDAGGPAECPRQAVLDNLVLQVKAFLAINLARLVGLDIGDFFLQHFPHHGGGQQFFLALELEQQAPGGGVHQLAVLTAKGRHPAQ